jgi:hypothetical protein
MRLYSWRFGLVTACAAVALFAGTASAPAPEERRGAPVDRLEQLEQRVNKMAQQQEQFMRRLGAQQERQAPMDAPRGDQIRRQAASPDRGRLGQPMPPVGAPGFAPAPAPGGPPPAAAKLHKDLSGLIGLCLLVAFIFNILLAIWIFTDIRKRGEGSGIFIVLALLAGIPAAII